MQFFRVLQVGRSAATPAVQVPSGDQNPEYFPFATSVGKDQGVPEPWVKFSRTTDGSWKKPSCPTYSDILSTPSSRGGGAMAGEEGGCRGAAHVAGQGGGAVPGRR